MFKRNVSSIGKATLCAALLLGLFTTAQAQRRPTLRELRLATGETVVVEREPNDVAALNTTARFTSNTPIQQASQWCPLAPLEGGPVQALANAEGRVYAGTLYRGVFVSADNGRTWREVNNGLGNFTVNALAGAGANVLAATNGGLYRTGDGGQSWTLAVPVAMRALAVPAAGLFAGSSAGRVFRSTDNGATWTERTALANAPIVYALTMLGENLLAGTSRGLFRSADNGAAWTALTAGLPNNGAPVVTALAVNGNNFYLGTGGVYRDAQNNFLPQVYVSGDNGQNWAGVGAAIRLALSSTTTGLPSVRALDFDGTNVLAGTGFGLAAFDGQTWSEPLGGRGLSVGITVSALLRNGGATLLGADGGVFTPAGDGQSWTPGNSGLTAVSLCALAVSGNSIFVCSGSSGFFRTNDNGQTWTRLAGVDNGAGRPFATQRFAVRGNTIFTSVYFGGVFRSNDNGATWTAINSGLRSLSSWPELAVSGDDVYALTAGFVHKLNAAGNGWMVVNATAISADTPAASGANLFAYAFAGSSLLRSSDGGVTFAPLNFGAPLSLAWAAAARGSNVYFSATANGLPRVFASTNNGETFAQSQSSLRANRFSFGGATLYAATDANGVYYSANNGLHWTPVNTGLPSRAVPALEAKGDTLLAGVNGFGVYAALKPELQPATLASVSAASYAANNELAPEAIAAAFGAGLATTALGASTTPLPTTLGGTRLVVRDSAGVERNAPLFFVAPGQVNYQVPPGTATGAATVIALSGDGQSAFGAVTISNVAPGFFAANANGQGVAAAVALRVKADGAQTFESVAELNPATGQFAARPLDLGPESEQVFLLLFGTGLRLRSGLTAVSARIGGVDAEVSFAGAQGDLIGTDQLNVRLPRVLAGRGEVEIVLMVDGKTANTVRMAAR